MKNILFLIATVILLVFVLPACRKCYVCKNTCSNCIKRDSVGVILSQYSLCSDSIWYKSKVSLFKDSGYNCISASSSYSDDFCVNTGDASDQYLLYHGGNGKYTCTPN